MKVLTDERSVVPRDDSVAGTDVDVCTHIPGYSIRVWISGVLYSSLG